MVAAGRDVPLRGRLADPFHRGSRNALPWSDDLDVQFNVADGLSGLGRVLDRGERPVLADHADAARTTCSLQSLQNSARPRQRLPSSAIARFTVTRSCARQIRISVTPGWPTR